MLGACDTSLFFDDGNQLFRAGAGGVDIAGGDGLPLLGKDACERARRGMLVRDVLRWHKVCVTFQDDHAWAVQLKMLGDTAASAVSTSSASSAVRPMTASPSTMACG